MTTAPLILAGAAAAALAADLGVHIRTVRQAIRGPSQATATVDVSGDGRFVAFVSEAQLSPTDTNTLADVYVLDRDAGRITLESVAIDGRAGNGSSLHPRLSHDGRILVFDSSARNLVEEPVAVGRLQVLRRDRATGTTHLVSRTAAGRGGNGNSHHPDVSADGRLVVFQSAATDLPTSPDANGVGADVYLFDTLGPLRRVSVTTGGDQPERGASWAPAIDGQGRYVVFTSSAALDPPAPAAPPTPCQVFVHDLHAGATRRLSRTSGGGFPDGPSFQPAISADGRVIAFASLATDLVRAKHRRGTIGVFLTEPAATRLALASRPRRGAADGDSEHPALSADGRYLLFRSEASNLAAGDDRNLVSDIYRLETVSGVLDRLSGGSPDDPWWAPSTGAALDASGRVVAFSSRHPIDAADAAFDDDLFMVARPAGEPRAVTAARGTCRPADPGCRALGR